MTPSTAPGSGAEAPLRAGVMDLIEEFDSLDALIVHGLAAIKAADTLGQLDTQADALLAAQMFVGRQRYESAVDTLQQLVEATDEKLILLKGAEVAQSYGDPAHRPFHDIDLLTESPDAVREDLVALGYEEIPGAAREDHHHLPPLRLTGDSIPIEIHRSPGWLPWMSPPDVGVLIGRSVPSRTGVPGLWTLDPVDQCLYLAVHAWGDGPWRRARDLLDIAILRSEVDQEELRRRAEEWGIGRMWKLSNLGVDALLSPEAPGLSARLLTAHIRRGRIRGPVAERASVYLADGLVTTPYRSTSRAVRTFRRSRARRRPVSA